MRIDRLRSIQVFETGNDVRVFMIDDSKLGFCEIGNLDAWVCSPDPLTLRNWC